MDSITSDSSIRARVTLRIKETEDRETEKKTIVAMDLKTLEEESIGSIVQGCCRRTLGVSSNVNVVDASIDGFAVSVNERAAVVLRDNDHIIATVQPLPSNPQRTTKSSGSSVPTSAGKPKSSVVTGSISEESSDEEPEPVTKPRAVRDNHTASQQESTSQPRKRKRKRRHRQCKPQDTNTDPLHTTTRETTEADNLRSQTPPDMAWDVHTVWQFLQQQKQHDQHSGTKRQRREPIEESQQSVHSNSNHPDRTAVTMTSDGQRRARTRRRQRKHKTSDSNVPSNDINQAYDTASMQYDPSQAQSSNGEVNMHTTTMVYGQQDDLVSSGLWVRVTLPKLLKRGDFLRFRVYSMTDYTPRYGIVEDVYCAPDGSTDVALHVYMDYCAQYVLIAFAWVHFLEVERYLNATQGQDGASGALATVGGNERNTHLHGPNHQSQSQSAAMAPSSAQLPASSASVSSSSSSLSTMRQSKPDRRRNASNEGNSDDLFALLAQRRSQLG